MTRLDHVDPRIVMEVFVIKPKETSVRINLERSHLLQAEGKIQIAVGEIRHPIAEHPPVTAAKGADITRTAKRKSVFFKPRGIRPHRNITGVSTNFPRRALGVF